MQFRWGHVDPALLRRMLAVVHGESGWRDDEKERRLERLDGGRLVAHALAVLGRHLDRKHLQVDALVDLLRDDWLPGAPPAVIENFAELMWYEVSSAAERPNAIYRCC